MNTSAAKSVFPAIIIALTGMITMIFEVSGSRVLGPYFGTSVFVWTALIGVIFASLSLGYWLGGKVSSKFYDFKTLSAILFLSAIFVSLTAYANIYILDRVDKYFDGIRLEAVAGAIILFGPASVLFGMVLPIGVKLEVNRMITSGRKIGKLYALSTAGSIAGTFLAGYLLMPLLGFRDLIYGLALILATMALVGFMDGLKSWLMIASMLVFLFIGFLWINDLNRQIDYIDTDTVYNRVIIFEKVDQATQRPVRMLHVNDENSSAMFLDKDDDLVFEVLKYYQLVEYFNPEFKDALMIGGSGYAFPKDYLKKYNGASIDVVEIDEGLTNLAYEYFNLKPSPRLNIIHEDGRTFLNKNQKKYDAIFMDAYKSMLTIPYQLTTREAVEKMYNNLNADGLVLANIIAPLSTDRNQFLQAQVKTYASVFPDVRLFAVQYPNPDEKQLNYFQNIMLVALKSDAGSYAKNYSDEILKMLEHQVDIKINDEAFIFTDEYAPVEYMASRLLK